MGFLSDDDIRRSEMDDELNGFQPSGLLVGRPLLL